MGKNLLAVLLVEFLDDVHSVVGVEVVDELLGDFLRRHIVEQLAAVVLVEFHEHIGGSLQVKEAVEVFGLLQVEILVEVSDVGRVQSVEKLPGGGFVFGGYY